MYNICLALILYVIIKHNLNNVKYTKYSTLDIYYVLYLIYNAFKHINKTYNTLIMHNC